MSRKVITDKSHFTVHKISNRIRSLLFVMYDDFFRDEIVYKLFFDRIEFYKPTLDSVKNILKSTKNSNGFQFSISEDLDIKPNNYNLEEIDEEDKRVFIFNK